MTQIWSMTNSVAKRVTGSMKCSKAGRDREFPTSNSSIAECNLWRDYFIQFADYQPTISKEHDCATKNRNSKFVTLDFSRFVSRTRSHYLEDRRKSGAQWAEVRRC